MFLNNFLYINYLFWHTKMYSFVVSLRLLLMLWKTLRKNKINKIGYYLYSLDHRHVSAVARIFCLGRQLTRFWNTASVLDEGEEGWFWTSWSAVCRSLAVRVWSSPTSTWPPVETLSHLFWHSISQMFRVNISPSKLMRLSALLPVQTHMHVT